MDPRKRLSKTKAIRANRDIFNPTSSRDNEWKDECADYYAGRDWMKQNPKLLASSLQTIKTSDNINLKYPNLFDETIPSITNRGSYTDEDTKRLDNIFNFVKKRKKMNLNAPLIKLTIDCQRGDNHVVHSLVVERERLLPTWIREKRPWVHIVIHWIHSAENESHWHGNIAWINYRSKTIELFEPWGMENHYKQSTRNRADRMEHVRAWLQTRRCLKEFTVDVCDFPKYLDKPTGPQVISDDSGNCGLYCVLFVHLKLLNPKLSTHDIWFSFFNEFIRRYPAQWKSKVCEWVQRYKFWSFYIRPSRVRPFLK